MLSQNALYVTVAVNVKKTDLSHPDFIGTGFGTFFRLTRKWLPRLHRANSLRLS
jgi:hypothetical protein